MTLLGLDLGINRTGFCYGDGASMPTCGCWRFPPPTGNDLGELGVRFGDRLRDVHRAANVSVVLYESPLLRRYDKLLSIRKVYGMGFWLETWCKEFSIKCEEASPARVKKELTGQHAADKDTMVMVAKRIGVALPPNAEQGMEDAADAFACWLFAVRLHARQYAADWDRKLYTRLGALT